MQILHFAFIYLMTDMIPKYIPKGLSLSELNIYLYINALYICFCVDAVAFRAKRLYIAGNNTYNAIIFSPVNFKFLNHC